QSIPSSLHATCPALTALSVSHNEIQSLDWSLGLLFNQLKVLEWHGNPFRALPNELLSFNPRNDTSTALPMLEFMRDCFVNDMKADPVKRSRLIAIGNAA